jgi:hypothetical protein
MYYDEHNPPHFHAIYGEYEASISIETLTLIGGQLPARAFGLVMEWAAIHKAELMKHWQAAKAGGKLGKIKPLK